MKNKTLSSAIKKIAVSYILIYFNINISIIDLLPDWLGYFMIVSALGTLAIKEESAGLLKPFGIALAISNLAGPLLSLVGYSFNLTVLNILLGIITIYFNFQLITNIASLDIEPQKRKRLLVLRSVTVLLHTIMTLSLFLPYVSDHEIYSYILMFMAVPQIIICLWITAELFSLAKFLKEKETEKEEPFKDIYGTE